MNIHTRPNVYIPLLSSDFFVKIIKIFFKLLLKKTYAHIIYNPKKKNNILFKLENEKGEF